MQDKNVISVYNQIKKIIIVDKELDAGSLVGLVTHLIPIVQKIATGGSGIYKKTIVITVLEMVIKDSKLDDNVKDSLNILVQTTIPITIDIMINIANGNIDLAKSTKGCFGCFKLK
jgi:hypothetical protein